VEAVGPLERLLEKRNTDFQENRGFQYLREGHGRVKALANSCKDEIGTVWSKGAMTGL
jgi:hypothetical protein